MKDKYLNAIKKATSIIRMEIKKGKTPDYIKDQIYYMLINLNIGIKNLDYFDRFYFHSIVGETISSHIREQQLEYAILKFEKMPNSKLLKNDSFFNVSRFKTKYYLQKEGQIMKKYMVTDLYEIESTDFILLSNQESNKNILLIEGTTKDNVIEKYLNARYEFEQQTHLKEMLFYDFWISVGYGEYEFVNHFENSEAILQLADNIYNQFFQNTNTEPEKIYNKYDTKELVENYWELLNEEDAKEAYYLCNRYDVVCLELNTLANFKKQQRINSRNIVDDITQEDSTFWNIISNLIHTELKESYSITLKTLTEYGLSLEDSEELLNYCISEKLNSVVSMTFTNGNFGCWALSNLFIHHRDDTNKDEISIEVFPSNTLYKLAEAGYDFKNGKDALATEVLTKLF